MDNKVVAVVGGGAAGFFFAINYKALHSVDDVTIYEQGKTVLNKVRISGGGRCNVTHACFDPGDLVHYYPRGRKELIGPFHRWSCGDTVGWFEERGVPLKIEADGRMFPVSDRSESIINCFIEEANRMGIKIVKQCKVSIDSLKDRRLTLSKGASINPDVLFLAPGSSKFIWNVLKANGVEIVEPVPSLFTFNIKDPRIKGLAGISFNDVEVVSEYGSYQSRGPLLITHWGLSAPSILKLSSVEARLLSAAHYSFKISVDFLPDLNPDDVQDLIIKQGGKKLGDKNPFGLPKRYWRKLIEVAGINSEGRWADLKKEERSLILESLKACTFQVKGKSTFKEEFVSAGGIDLKEVDFRSFGLKRYPGVYAAGEVLNIDAMTGGFNFQAAWTGGYIAAINAS
ncbi:MAG: NAD(P)/FAD-dependent oxidoreductase [Saprospiraceae bacterium]|nr:NAD(P)/FAD-dependent oxidoreductase [Saprospiraceae bacterium]